MGGKYGTTINLNYSRVHAIDTTKNVYDTNTVNGKLLSEGNLYSTKFLSFGKQVFFEDFNIEVQKKWSKEFKTNFVLKN